MRGSLLPALAAGLDSLRALIACAALPALAVGSIACGARPSSAPTTPRPSTTTATTTQSVAEIAPAPRAAPDGSAAQAPQLVLATAWPAMPTWEKADLELHDWDDLLGGMPRDLDRRATAMSDLALALPEVDPRIAEALCTAGRDASFGQAQAAFLRGIAVLRGRQLSPDDAYGSLLERMFATQIEWTFGPAKTRRTAVRAEILEYGGSCDIPDLANLEREQADSYNRIGKKPGGTPTLRKPNSTRKLSPRLAHIVALREEVEASVGVKHPYAAAMQELVAKHCDDFNERARDPKACPTLEAAFQNGLDVRLAALGEDHPATRDALLRVGALRLAANKVAVAEALLKRAAAGGLVDDAQIAATMLIAGIEYGRGDVPQALEHARLAAEASETARHGRSVFDDPWKLLRDMANAVGDLALARHADEQLSRRRLSGGSLGLAQRLDEIGKPDLAGAALDRVIDEARLEVEHGPPERASVARARLRNALFWRASFHHWHGASSNADVTAVLALDRQGP